MNRNTALYNQSVSLNTYEKRSKHKNFWFHIKQNRYLYLLALPGIIFFLLFKYVPMFGVVVAFQDYSPYKGMLGSPWVGFEYFQRFFSNPDFLKLFRNTLAINILNLVFFFPIPIILSLLLNEVKNSGYKRLVQSIVYLPHFLSWVIIVTLTYLFLSQSQGIINKIIMYMGYNSIDYLTSPNYFWILLTIQSMWKEAGWGTIIILAAMAGIPVEQYEAAEIDGARRFQQMWYVTLPSIKNVIITLLILKIGHIMDVGFEQVFLMKNGAVSDVADVFDTYVYRVGIQQGQFGMSTAVGLFKSTVGLALVILSNRLAKKFNEQGIY